MIHAARFYMLLGMAALSLGLARPGYGYNSSGPAQAAGQMTGEQKSQEIGGKNPPAVAAPSSKAIDRLLKTSNELVGKQKYDEALAKLNEIDGMSGKTESDTYLANRTRIVVALKTDNQALLLPSLKAVVESGLLPLEERKDFSSELAKIYFRQKDYPQTISTLSRYFGEGGADSEMRRLLISSYSLSGNVERARDEAAAAVQADEQAGKKPSDEILRLQADCAAKLKDQSGYTAVIEKLAQYYPQKKYWSYLMSRLTSKPGFSDRLMLDVYRFMQATEQLDSAKDYIDMSKFALQGGYAIEAKKVLDQGFQKGVLGTGEDAAKQRELQARTEKAAAADLSDIAKKESVDAKSDKANEMVNAGYVYVVRGEFDKGLGMMEQGIHMDDLKRPDDAKLHLGVAYAMASRKDDAVRVLKTVEGKDGSGDLARYWIMHLERKFEGEAKAASPR